MASGSNSSRHRLGDEARSREERRSASWGHMRWLTQRHRALLKLMRWQRTGRTRVFHLRMSPKQHRTEAGSRQTGSPAGFNKQYRPAGRSPKQHHHVLFLFFGRQPSPPHFVHMPTPFSWTTTAPPHRVHVLIPLHRGDKPHSTIRQP